MSIGIATRWSGNGEDVEALLHRADQAMYAVEAQRARPLARRPPGGRTHDRAHVAALAPSRAPLQGLAESARVRLGADADTTPDLLARSPPTRR